MGQFSKIAKDSLSGRVKRSLFAGALAGGFFLNAVVAPVPALAQAAKAAQVMSAEDVQHTFPPSVYFQGKTAPVQMRNAAAVHFADGAIFFAGLVDTSGYSSGVQERYQMYLLLEHGLRIAGKAVPAGAYGAGFVKDHFLLMDIGGKTLFEAPLQNDSAFSRPRPLQIVTGSTGTRLYVGRQWVEVAPGS